MNVYFPTQVSNEIIINYHNELKVSLDFLVEFNRNLFTMQELVDQEDFISIQKLNIKTTYVNSATI